MAGNKKTHNIYLIDIEKVRNHFELEENISNALIAKKIMENDNQYKIQELKDNVDTQPFSVSLYFRIDYIHNSKLSMFCSSFVKEDQDVLKLQTSNSSSVMFVWNSNHVYAITTGQGFRIVENYAVPKFGLLITTAYEQSFKVTSLQSNELSSIVQSSQTIYTTEVAFQSIDKLDTVFKEIGGRLNNRQLVRELLDLKDDSKKSSMRLKAKDYLQFGSSMDFNGLLHLLQILDEINISDLSDGFNTITLLTKKKDSDLIDALNSEIVNMIYRSISDGKDSPFELFHQDTDNFIFADRYQVYQKKDIYADKEDYNATNLLNEAFETYLDDNDSDEDKFNMFIRSSRIRTFREDRVITDGSMLSHVYGEVEYNDNLYYVIDGKYYLQTTSYVNRLKAFLKMKFHNVSFVEEIRTNWIKTKNKKEYTEDWFNQTVSKEENYIQLHKVIPKPYYIEFADLIKFTNNTLTIVHVKDGFDGAMRILDRQVEMSIRMLTDIKYNNNDTFMRCLYQEAVKDNQRTNICSYFKSEEQFVKKIKESKARYIIVIRPPESAKKDLLSCKSNSAKHCLNELIDRCFQRGIELNIQVKVPFTEVK